MSINKLTSIVAFFRSCNRRITVLKDSSMFQNKAAKFGTYLRVNVAVCCTYKMAGSIACFWLSILHYTDSEGQCNDERIWSTWTATSLIKQPVLWYCVVFSFGKASSKTSLDFLSSVTSTHLQKRHKIFHHRLQVHSCCVSLSLFSLCVYCEAFVHNRICSKVHSSK